MLELCECRSPQALLACDWSDMFTENIDFSLHVFTRHPPSAWPICSFRPGASAGSAFQLYSRASRFLYTTFNCPPPSPTGITRGCFPRKTHFRPFPPLRSRNIRALFLLTFQLGRQAKAPEFSVAGNHGRLPVASISRFLRGFCQFVFAFVYSIFGWVFFVCNVPPL